MILKEWGQESVFSTLFIIDGDHIKAMNDHLASKAIVRFAVLILRLMWKTKAIYNEETNALRRQEDSLRMCLFQNQLTLYQTACKTQGKYGIKCVFFQEVVNIVKIQN